MQLTLNENEAREVSKRLRKNRSPGGILGGDVEHKFDRFLRKCDLAKFYTEQGLKEDEECQCDLCQCFGHGDCYDHNMNCEHCKEGRPGTCQWCEEI